MKTIFIKTLEEGRVIEAPKNYKNISNFNKFPSLMKKEGFEERIKAWKKSDGTMKYVEPQKWGQHKTYYTDFPYPGKNYEWSDTADSWQLKLEILKEQKLVEIRNATNAYMRQLKKGFSDAEMETWSRQENGVKLLAVDPESTEYDAEWVRQLAATRGITLEEQIQRITYATTLMNTYAYQLVGYQQRLEDAINAASSYEELLAIKFNINQ